MGDSFPMTGGDGLYSYAKNSNLQKESAEKLKGMLVGSIVENLDINSSKSFRIVDFGCSTGPNTFVAVDTIIQGITQKYQQEGISNFPQIQVFFSDHVSNDFNILFANIPKDKKYFAAGVPGSFHGRLFPRASLNFVYSSHALQWLSKVPEEITDASSPSFNKGRIFYANAPSEVGQAYRAQHARDIEAFLGARAEEVAPGGLMALLLSGRHDGTSPAEYSLGPVFEPLESTLLDLANEGVLSHEKIDSFNLPIFCSSTEELRTIIQENGCFEILILEKQVQEYLPVVTTAECRAGFESIIRNHFGDEIIEQLFDRYSKTIEDRLPLRPDDGIAIGLFILLKRNP